MLPTVLTLAFVIPIPFFRPVLEHTNQGAWNELVAAFSQRGVAVSGDHPRCRERDLYGLYVRGSKRVVVCDRPPERERLPAGDEQGLRPHRLDATSGALKI